MVERDGDGPTPKTGPDTPAFAGRVTNLCAVGRADVAHTVSSVKDPLGNPVPNDFFARRDAAAAVAGMVVAEATALNPMNVMQFMRRTVTVRVEYADGGTEMWYMNVFSTDNVRPVGGSLKLGDGVDRNASC